MAQEAKQPTRKELGRAGTVRARLFEQRVRRRWVPTAAGWLCFLIGLLDVSTVVAPRVHRHLERVGGWFPGVLTVTAAHAATVIVGLLLLMLSRALRRRKERAWRAAVALLAMSIVFHLVRGLFVGQAVTALVLLAALVYYRGEFYARGDPRTRWKAAGALCLMIAFSLVIGLTDIAVNSHALVRDYSSAERIQHVIYGMLGMSGPVRFVGDARNDFLDVLTSLLGLMTLVVTAYLVFRPAAEQSGHGPEDERRMRELLGRHGGRDSLGYFALREDKSVVWSPTGKACVAYRVVGGVMLASGDPIGDPEAWPGAIGEFMAKADRHAWVPAVIGCSELGGEIWTRESGLIALELGDEAIVSVADFSLEGRAMRNVRQMVSRVERNGYTARLRRVKDVPPGELAEIRAKAAGWLGEATERGFSMALGRLGGPGDDECVVATATRDGELCAVLHFAPWGSDGLSLDLMRRDRGSQPGLNDFLIARSLRCAPTLGVRRISLNFAVFRSALERGERLGAGPVARAWRALLIIASRWFQIESLYRFNAKYRPVWQPRFAAFPTTRDALRVGIAALMAEAFIVLPPPLMRRRR